MESFFSSLKLERVSRLGIASATRRADLFDYIERFCVVDKSRTPCSSAGIAESRRRSRTRVRSAATAPASSASRRKIHGPSGRGCFAFSSPRSTARRKVRALMPIARAASRHRQPDVVLRQAGRGGARAHDVLELRALQALPERVVVVETVQE